MIFFFRSVGIFDGLVIVAKSLPCGWLGYGCLFYEVT